MFEVLAGVMSANTSRKRSIVFRDRKRENFNIPSAAQGQLRMRERERTKKSSTGLYLDLNLVDETYFEQAV